VITATDEEQFTNYGIVRDRFNALVSAYNSFLGGSGPNSLPVGGSGADDRGRQLTQLQRELDLIAEVAEELDGAYLSVDIGPDEREVQPVDENDASGATVQDLVDGARTFPSMEARPLIQDGGTRGVQLLGDRLQVLSKWTEAALHATASTNGGPPSGFRHPRVRVALSKLGDSIQAAADAAEDFDSDGDSQVVAVAPTDN